MCCEICPKYDECDEKKQLKDQCCPECSEYDYCMGENKYTDENLSNNEDDYNIGDIPE